MFKSVVLRSLLGIPFMWGLSILGFSMYEILPYGASVLAYLGAGILFGKSKLESVRFWGSIPFVAPMYVAMGLSYFLDNPFNWPTVFPILPVSAHVSFLIGIETRQATDFRGKWMIAIAIWLSIAASYLWWGIPRIVFYKRDVLISVPVNDIQIAGITCDSLHFEDLKGKIVILDFWNTRCGYCYDMKPEMLALATQYKNDPRVHFASVASAHYDSLSDVLAGEFIEIGHPASMPEYYDHTGELARRLAPAGCPIVTFVDQRGVAVLSHHGYDSDTRRVYRDLLEKQLLSMLGDKN